MKIQGRGGAFLRGLCSHEKAIVRSISLLLSLFIMGTVFSGFCYVNVNHNESAQMRSNAIDFEAAAESTASFRIQYNTLQAGSEDPIADLQTISASVKTVNTAIDKFKMMIRSLNAKPSEPTVAPTAVLTEEEQQRLLYTLQKTAATETEQTSAQPAVVAEADEAAPAPVAAALTVPASVAETTPVETTMPETVPPTTDPPTEIPSEGLADDIAETPYSTLTAAANVATVSGKTPPSTLYLDENGVPVSYSRVLVGNASAYSGDARTSTGTVPIPGSIAVDPSIIPYGTQMWIVSADGQYVYGYAVAEDTGGFIRWHNAPIADLFFNTSEECVAFGRRDIVIYIL